MDKNRSDKQTGLGKKGQAQDQGNTQRKKEPTASSHRSEQNRHQQPGSNVSQQTGQETHKSATASAQGNTSQNSKSEQNITNQDEQRQVTNAGAGSNPMGEEETEGDRQREERLKPYKNVGDDSGETEKNSPTMK
jgi:hypothetical protein